MRLILNADDFGLCKGVNLGIIEAYKEGIVRSATLMAGMEGFEHAVCCAKANPGLKTGVHLTLTAGKSVGGVYKTITDRSGNFFSQTVFFEQLPQMDLDEVEQEYEAQIQKILEAGIKVDHFDSHHHTHLCKGVFQVFLKLAQKYKVGVRVYSRQDLPGEYRELRSPDVFLDSFYGDMASAAQLKELAKEYDGKTIEVMCHPGYVDYTLYRGSTYNVQRTKELSILTCGEIQSFINEQKIELCSYSSL